MTATNALVPVSHTREAELSIAQRLAKRLYASSFFATDDMKVDAAGYLMLTAETTGSVMPIMAAMAIMDEL